MRHADQALIDLARGLQALGYHFTAISPESQRRVSERPCMRWARDVRDVFGWGRPFEMDGKVVSEPLLAMLDAAGVLVSAGDGAWRSRVRFATAGELLLAHAASAPLGADTYRTLALLEREVKPARVAADIGGGVGAAGLWLSRHGRALEVVLIDDDPEAQRLAHVNARVNEQWRVLVLPSESALPPTLDLIALSPSRPLEPRVERTVRALHDNLGRLASGGRLVLCAHAPIIAGVDALRLALKPLLAAEGDGLSARYLELEPDVCGEALADEGFADVERIAAVALVVDRVVMPTARACMSD